MGERLFLLDVVAGTCLERATSADLSAGLWWEGAEVRVIPASPTGMLELGPGWAIVLEGESEVDGGFSWGHSSKVGGNGYWSAEDQALTRTFV